VTIINRLKELLRNRLIECGWRDELKQYCKGWSICCNAESRNQTKFLMLPQMNISIPLYINYEL